MTCSSRIVLHRSITIVKGWCYEDRVWRRVCRGSRSAVEGLGLDVVRQLHFPLVPVAEQLLLVVQELLLQAGARVGVGRSVRGEST